MKHKDLEVLTFTAQKEWWEWLADNHQDLAAYWLRFAKKASKKQTISYEEAREAALAHGWVDGLINRWDEDYYLIRFSHRRPKSIWSKINVGIVERLRADGRLHSEGQKEADAARSDGRWDAAY